jgi:multiple sugar transport system permease protein
VTLPMISPIIFFNTVLAIIASFQIFTPAFVMTNGGPANASLFIGLYLYNNAFKFFQMGYASALAWLVFLIIMALTLLVVRSSPYWVYYEGGPAGRA